METDLIEQAQKLPRGARFYRCALQVNPHHYAGTYRGQSYSMDENTYIEQLLAQCEELEVEVLAVTDHNHAGSIDLLRREAAKRGVHIFPGFELSSHEGVHVLCIYPPDTSEIQLGRFLGKFELYNIAPCADKANQKFVDILRIVRDQGGITIAAHVTQNNGWFTTLKGQTRIEAWQNENLLAVQIPGAVADLPPEILRILRNKNKDYQRKHPASSELAIAIVNARDIKAPDDLADPSATCWIKMSEVSIEGLRQAFLDPGSRIRLNSDPELEKHAEFVAITWQGGGFIDGTMIHFNENLNVLIGGRGTGKSTVVESLRYVLDLEPLGEEARKAHEGIVRQVLRNGTKISLLVRSYHPTKRDYRIERTVPNPPLVRDVAGTLLNLIPQDILPQVEVYGQHEIAELARSPEKLVRLLNRFGEQDTDLARRKGELKRELERSRNRLLEVREELKHIEERLASLPGLEETLKRFQEKGLEERLKEQSLLVREERVLKTIPERLAPLRELLEQLRRELPIDRTFLSARALAELPGREILAQADPVFEQLSRELEAAVAQMVATLEHADQGLAVVSKHWEERRRQVQAEYEQILRKLQKEKVDGEEFMHLRRQIEELRPLKERQDLLRGHEKEHADYRRQLLAEWEDSKAEECRRLQAAANEVERQLTGQVQVQVNCTGNCKPLFDFLYEQVGGRLAETIETLGQCENFSLTEFASACRNGRDALVEKFGLVLAQADRLATASPAVILQMEELDLPPTTQIKLNVAAEGQPAAWTALESLSTGQKATAVLLLLLLESNAPLVVDQPEDDLDNRFITEGVVPRMREEKRRRQFIFATHNANIPVLGDAELILGLQATGEPGSGGATIPPEHRGSIDSLPVRELVEEVLEGGKTAFETRRLKYGF
jgi:predicted metal-dependent phosphoesterase TrpH